MERRGQTGRKKILGDTLLKDKTALCMPHFAAVRRITTWGKGIMSPNGVACLARGPSVAVRAKSCKFVSLIF